MNKSSELDCFLATEVYPYCNHNDVDTIKIGGNQLIKCIESLELNYGGDYYIDGINIANLIIAIKERKHTLLPYLMYKNNNIYKMGVKPIVEVIKNDTSNITDSIVRVEIQIGKCKVHVCDMLISGNKCIMTSVDKRRLIEIKLLDYVVDTLKCYSDIESYKVVFFE